MRRLVLYTCMVFVTAFVGISWAARGFPTQISIPALVQPLRPTLNVRFGDQSGEQYRERLAQQQLRDPDNYRRDPLRLDALQAANGYALSPCDRTMKANLVAAMRAYASAAVEIRKCNVVLRNCDAEFDRLVATYATPLDLRVKAALHEAFTKGGISKADFPPDMATSVMTLANSSGSPVSACEHPTAMTRR
jgi:hypothetical protein